MLSKTCFLGRAPSHVYLVPIPVSFLPYPGDSPPYAAKNAKRRRLKGKLSGSYREKRSYEGVMTMGVGL